MPTHFLDTISALRRIDTQGMIDSIEQLADQYAQVQQDWRALKMPASVRGFDSIVLNGMGGSGLAAHVVQSVFRDSLRQPFDVVHGYTLPASVNRRTLYIVVSYSGNTEEPLATIAEARRRNAKIVVITKGGKLQARARQLGLPAYVFAERHNPCGQPRMGIGYNLLGLLMLLRSVGAIKLTETQLSAGQAVLRGSSDRIGVAVPLKSNPAKRLAVAVHGGIPIIVGAEFLEGSAHIVANQINENGKNFAMYFAIPELNHHLMEGLGHPAPRQSPLRFVFLDSRLYDPRNLHRVKLTRHILKEHHFVSSDVSLRARTPYEQVWESLAYGSYLSYYLALLNRVNPSPIPWVDYFKARLSAA